MRFKSALINGYTIHAVAGTNTVSFAIDSSAAKTKGLLGFSVQRTYGDQFHWMPGFKIFKAHQKDFPAAIPVSTETEPVQSFVWDDFTLKPGTKYTYKFYPALGDIDSLTHAEPIPITVTTEPLYKENDHDIFFNRGVASSQAYAHEFNNISPDKLVGKKRGRCA